MGDHPPRRRAARGRRPLTEEPCQGRSRALRGRPSASGARLGGVCAAGTIPDAEAAGRPVRGSARASPRAGTTGPPTELGGCPMGEPTAFPYDDPAFVADPFPFYRTLRGRGPVRQVVTIRGVEAWLITRYEDGARRAVGPAAQQRPARRDRHAPARPAADDGTRVVPAQHDPRRPAGPHAAAPPGLQGVHRPSRRRVAPARSRRSPTGCWTRSRRPARPTSSPTSRCRCRSPSSASSSACPARTATGSRSGPTSMLAQNTETVDQKRDRRRVAADVVLPGGRWWPPSARGPATTCSARSSQPATRRAASTRTS